MRTVGDVVRRRKRCHSSVVVAAAALSLLAAACGTQVDKQAYLGSLASTDGGDGSEAVQGPAGTDGGQRPVGGATSAPVTQGGQQTTRGPGATAGSGGSGSTPSSGSSRGTASTPSGLSTTVVGNTIMVGMHLPETGAAPLPMSWRGDLEVVQRYMNDRPVNGRKMDFTIQDDGYDPAMGMAACKKLVDAQPLLVIGHTSPAVQSQCVPIFNANHIPYLLRGSPRSFIAKCPICYFGTISDDAQGKLLADYVINRMGGAGKKIGIVWQNDQPTAKDTFIAQAKAKGVKVAVVTSSVPKQADFSSIVVKLQQAGVSIALLSMPPVDAIKLSVQAQSQGYHPTWLGGGTYWNYNMTLESAGMAMDGAITFSPWPSIDSAAANAWKSAYQQYKPGSQPTDVGLIMWGWANLVRAAAEKAGPNLSRASFVAAMNSLQFNQPYWNPANYMGNRYGPLSVAVFQGDGQAKRWRQISAFSSSF